MRLHELASPTRLAACFAAVRARSRVAGLDGVSPEAFAADLDRRLEALAARLRDGSWQASSLLRITKPKPGGGARRLSIPTVEDRIVIELLGRILEPEIEPLLCEAAFAYRPGRSARGAVEAVERHIEQGMAWAALGDIRDFFDTVPLDGLSEQVKALCLDPAVSRLLEKLLTRHALRPGRGLAQGSSLSPLLSNLVLTPLDRRLCTTGFPLVRYCDNLCIPAGGKPAAEEALQAMRREVERLGLSLKPAESRLAEVKGGFLWLGFWLGPSGCRVSEGAVEALRARVAEAGRGLEGERLRVRLEPIVRGWIQYFDAPLPEGVSLGEHDTVVRGLLSELGHTGSPAGQAPQGEAEPASLFNALGSEGDDGDPWEDVPVATSRGAADREPRIDALLQEADRLAAAGDFRQAEAAYEEAQALVQAPLPSPAPPVIPPYDEERLDGFIGLFCAGQEAFETAPRGTPGRRDFTDVKRPPGPADVRAHLAGEASIAVRPRLPDGTCTLGVIDLDGDGPGAEIAVQAYAEALASVARAFGFSVLLERTGGRGMHLWIPVADRIGAGVMARALEALERAAGAPAAGVRVERLPGGDGAPDVHTQAITLPLGRHVETGEESRLRWAHGPLVEPDRAGLFDGLPNAPAVLSALPSTAEGQNPMPRPAEPAPAGPFAWETLGGGVSKVMAGCALLRHLAEKAAATGHLSHAERLSLLYSLGHLGKPGEQAILTIIKRCQNYDAAETARQISKLGGLPISCTRMREKHGTPALLPLCNCELGEVRRRGGYPTPLLHAVGFRRSWRDVLRGRRDTEAAAQAAGLDAAVAVPEPALATEIAPTAERKLAAPEARAEPMSTPDRGVLLAGAPPHEWA